MAECALPMDSVSPLTTSRDARSVPASTDPRGLRHSARSFLAYSSSIAARAVQRYQKLSTAIRIKEKKTYCCRKPLTHRMSLWHCACAQTGAQHPRHLCPRSYWQLDEEQWSVCCFLLDHIKKGKKETHKIERRLVPLLLFQAFSAVSAGLTSSVSQRQLNLWLN